MSDLEELFERSDELRSILDESRETELSEYINKYTADEISDFFGMLLSVMWDDVWKATKYLRAITDSCLNQMVDARTKREREDLSNKTIQIMRTYFKSTYSYTEKGYKAARAGEKGSWDLQTKTMAEHDNIRKIADEVAQGNPQLSKSAIAKILKRKHGIKLAESTIREIIRDWEIKEDTDPFPFA